MSTVLLVEDDEDVRELVSTVLALEADRVVSCGDGESALRLLGEISPDLVVLDVSLPGGWDGLALAREIRRRRPTGPPRLLTLTAYAAERDLEAARLAGVDAHVAKPFDMADLLARVRALLPQDQGPDEDKTP